MSKKQNIKAPAPQSVQTTETDYTPEKVQVAKDLYQRDKDVFFADERLYRQDSVGQRGSLGKFFDQYSSPYYKGAGVEDENLMGELKSKFIEDNIGKLSLSKKKEEEEAIPLEFPDVMDKSQIYSQAYSKQDVVRPLRSDIDVSLAKEGIEAMKISDEKISNTIPKLLKMPDFNYIKSRPEAFMELQDGSEKKRVTDQLKNMELSKEERQRAYDLLSHSAETEFISNSRKKFQPGQLDAASLKESENYIKDAGPGTWIDPETGNRKNKPETEGDADQLALITKYQKEILNGMISNSVNNPLSKQKDTLDEAQMKLSEEYDKVEEKRIILQDSMKKGGMNWINFQDDWKNAQFEFIKNQKDLELKIKDYNDKIDQDGGSASSVSNDPTDKQRLQEIVNDAYILKKHWDQRVSSLDEAIKAKEAPGYNARDEKAMRGLANTRNKLKEKKAQATAYFEAASRMAYNNEGPADIKKDAGFLFEVMGDAMNKGILKPYFKQDQVTERTVLNKMGEIGIRQGVDFTPDEKVNLETSFLEHAMSFTGSLIPDLPGLILVGNIAGLGTRIPYIQKLTKGYKVLRNAALEGEGAIIGGTVKNKAGQTVEAIYKGKPKSLKRMVAFDDPVPTGWQVIREARPTAISKIKGAVLNTVISEASFTGLMGMAPGMISGMNAAHVFLPNIKLKGPVGNIVQPYLDQFYKSAIGATIGMEAGGITAGMGKALFTDSTFKDEMDAMYPNLDDATKRVLAEVAVNGIFFGGMGAMTTGSMKAMTAPLGAKYGKYGGANFTAYFNPKMRSRVFEAARTADSKGYTDTAKELYQWLDMTKEPITGAQLKEARIAETEAVVKIMPVGVIRNMANANRKAIEILESANNDPNFDGYVTLQTQSVEGLKPMDVVKMGDRYYEVEVIQRDKAGNPLEFQLKDIENQEVTKALPEDVNADLHYRINSKLEIAFRLENHYEKLQILNESLAEKGFYGKEALPEGPPPAKKLKESTGDFYVKPPEPTKIQRRQKQLQEQEAQMKKDGIEPIELPAKLKKEYVFGVPDKIMEMPAGEFSDNLMNAGTVIGGQVAEYDKRIADFKTKLEDPEFQGRLDLKQRRSKQEINDEITRLEFAKKKVQPKFENELSNFYQDARVTMENLIKTKGEFTPAEVEDIIQNAWTKMQDPGEMKGQTIGEIFEQTIQEYTKEEPSIVTPETIAKDLGLTYSGIWKGEGGFPDKDIFQYKTPKGDQDTFTMPIGSTAEQIAEEVKKMDAKWIKTEVKPMDRMREIEGLAKTEGYRFEVNADVDMSTVDVFDSENKPIAFNDLPYGIKNLADEFTNLMHEEAISTSPEEFKIGKQTFKNKQELFTWLDENYNEVDRFGSTNEDGYLETNTMRAFSEWYDKNKARLALKDQQEALSHGNSPRSWRQRGYRIYEGVRYERQEPIKTIETGGNTNIIFSKKDKVPGYFAVVDKATLQPAHQSGQENPNNFIPEAQPRNRGNLKTLSDEARRKSQELDPEQLGFSPNAYTGAPIVNNRGEVIQGNGRVEALKYYYDTTTRDPRGYIEYLKENARHFGLNPDDIERIKEPVLVRMIDVSDEEAIRLGNYGMNDIEDVVEGTTHMSKATNRMSKEQSVTISNIVMQGNTTEDTLNDLIRKNARAIMKRLVNFNVIQQGDSERFFNKQGEVKPEGIAFVEGLMKGMLFRDANPKTLQSFESLPFIVKKGIEKSLPIILRLPDESDLTGTLQNVINGIYDFEIFRTGTGETKAGVKAWAGQGDMYSPMPKDIYSAFELALIDRMANAKNQTEIVKIFREYEMQVIGYPATLLDPAKEGVSKAEAIKNLFNTEYTPTVNDQLIKQEDEKQEKPSGSEGKGTTPKPSKGAGGKEEITPKETKVIPVDITKDLKDMTDLLKLLGDPEAGFGAGAGDDMDLNMKIKLNTIATNVIGKFIQAEVYDFPTMLTSILPQVELPMMNKLLPFLKQGYGALSMNSTDAIMEKLSANLPAVRQFSSKDLDNLIAEMNKPAVEDDFSDIVGKEFNIVGKNKKITVIRVEQWDDPRDQKIELMEGGLFGTLPAEFEPVLAAVTSDLTAQGLGKEGISLNALRKAIKEGKAVFVPPYVPKEARVKAMDDIADELERLGDIDAARIFRAKGRNEPPIGQTLEQELEGMKAFMDNKMTILKIKAGEVWFDRSPFIMVNETMLFDMVGKLHKGDRVELERYIRASITSEELQKALHLESQRFAWMSMIGMTEQGMRELPFIDNQFKAISVRGYLLWIGQSAEKIANGDKRVNPEVLERYKNMFREALVSGQKNIERLKNFILTWKIKYMLNTGQDMSGRLRKIANDIGISKQSTIREQAELALVELSSRIAQNRLMSIEDRYNRILNLYNLFPRLDVFATSDVKTLQQYSTPVPIGYLMGVYTNIDQVNHSIDTSAGNGALLIGANKKGAIANEIDENRVTNLMTQGYRTLTYDATQDLKGKFGTDSFDAIQTNPPFGPDVSGTFAGGFNLKGTHFMVANSLELLSENGKAAIIIGEHTKFEPNGRIKGSDLQFFNYLNRHFYVEDVINIPGDFYSKMGTSYPVRMILINGRKPAPEGAAPLKSERDEPVTSWTDLLERIQKLTTEPNEKSILRSQVDAIGKSGAIIRSGDPIHPKTPEDIGPVAKPSEQIPGTLEVNPGEGQTPIDRITPGSTPRIPTGGPVEPDNELIPDVKPDRSSEDPIIRQPSNSGEIQPKGGAGDIQPNQPRGPIERTKRALGLTDREKDSVVLYSPLSRIPGGGSLVPGAMANELEEALMQLKGEVGDIDAYVMSRLKYNSLEDISAAFYAEQVDGIGMAIFNIENGDGTIIGDQTGVGKGRIAAGVIAYAMENGYVPVFITKSANLFTDIYRDLIGIGKGHYVPMIMNKEYQGEMTKVYKPNSDEMLFQWNKAHYDNAIQRGVLPGKANVVLTTYSQFNTDEGNSLKRREFMMNLADRAIFIMDESHDASGASNTGKFFKDFVLGAKGGVFLSATFAKRPDNLPIYAMKTVMKEANMTYEELVEAIAKGGPALQEIISSQLAESIQFTRRQLNMENIERNWYILGDDDPQSFFYNMELNAQLKKDYDGITKIMHEIIQFQRDHIKPVIEGLDEGVKKEGEKAGIKKGTVDMGVTNTPYFSKVFNIVDQLLLAIKVKHAIPLIIDSLKAGRKPVITLKSTMEAMIQDLDLDYGFEIEADFRYVLKRGLDGVMRYTVKSAAGIPESKTLSLLDLSDMGKVAYKALNDKIKAISTGITISPIDVLIKGITDAGYKVAEITGRHSMFELDSEFKKGKFAINKRPHKNALINSFNNEPGWVAILNVSGSTGISMHSAPEFKDTSQRDSFNLQNDLDVNVVIQKEGRTNRTGQLNKPIYNNVLTCLPAEKRMAMMTAKKLKSLYANTSSNQKSSKAITEGTVDFLNKYGDEVVVEFLQENPDINNMMNKPIDLSKDSPDKQDAAHKVTGRGAVLPIEIQERFYDEISERYNALIEYLNDTGGNDLEITSEPLNAVTISREITVQGKGGISIFGDDTHLETVEVDILKKPLTKREIDDHVEKALAGKEIRAYQRELIAKMEMGIDDILGKKLKELQTSHDARVSAKRKEAQDKKGTAEDIEYWLNEQIDQMNTKHNNLAGMYAEGANINKDNFRKYINFFFPGKVLDVPFKADDQIGLIRLNKGVFMGFDINMNKPNPFTPSNVLLRFATADSRRMFRIPASKRQHIDSIIGNSYHISTKEELDTREDWDKLKPSRTREKRFIVTGNILQGIAKYKGRLIEYTMQDGTVKKGILMPENWVNEDTGKIIIPASKVYNIIRALAPMDFVESTSRNVQIQKDRNSYDGVAHYNLKVPASRTRGANYFTDKGLKELIYEGVFEVRQDWMVGRLNESRLMELLNYLQSRYGETFDVESRKIQTNESSQGSALSIISTFESAGKQVRGTGAIHPEMEVQGARSKINMGVRIKPEPITGQPPKKIWQIQKDFADALNQKIFWDKPARRGMAASYSAQLGKLVMQKMYMTDLNISAHELGHRLDDMFGLVGPEAQAMFHVYQQELKELWQFGSEPPKGINDPLSYKMKEGVAEYFRAYIVNPKETVRRYPMFSRWFEDRVKFKSPKIWDAIQQFSTDIRTYYGSSGLDMMGSNMKFGMQGKDTTPWGWTSLFRPTTANGNFLVTKFDIFATKMLNSGRVSEKAYRWALGLSGKDIKDLRQVPPSENFITLSHLLLGHMDKFGTMASKGVTNGQLEVQYDPKTKQAISFPWKFEALPDASISEMEEFRQTALKYMVAKRVEEAIWKFGAKQVRMDLNAFDSMLPPMDILKKYPHILNKYMPKIQRIIEKINNGDIDEDKVWLPEERYDFDNARIIGVAQEGFTDLMAAKKAIAEVDAMHKNAPEKAEMMNEYARRYQMISMHYVRYMHEAGLMSDQLYELITEEDLNYVALHRYYQETGPTDKEISGFGEMFSVGRDSRGYEGKLHIYPLKGSSRPIVDPDLIQMEAAYKAVLNSDKNNVLRHFVLAFTGARGMYEGEPVQIADVGYIVKGPGQHVLKFFVSGEAMYFKVQDPHVFRGIMQMTDTPNLPKIATFFPRLLRTSVTHSPAFVIRNPIRDFFQNMMIARTKFKITDLKSEVSGQMLDLAGMGQFGFYIRNYVDYHRMQKEWMFKHSNDPKKFFLEFKTFVDLKWDDLENLMSKSEKVNRIAFAKAEFNRLTKEGLDPYEALIQSAFEARDLMDFHVAGEWMKMINQFIPFSNAAIRGMDKLVRSTRDNPGKVLAWWGLIAILPSLANSLMIAMMDQDTIDEYTQLPPYQRDMFFNIPLGNGRWLTVPKPFELGYLSSGVQRIADKYLLGDNAGINEDWYRLGYNMLFPFDFAAITGGFSGFVHMATGKDFFRDKWIIPPDEMNTSISTRNTERATKVGQAIQNASRYIPFNKKREPLIDARKFDDLIMSQIPYYGTYMLKASEAISGGAKQRAMRFDWSDLGVIKTSPVYAAEDVQWVLKTAKKYKLTNRWEMDILNGAIRVYFSEEVQADRPKMLEVGRHVRNIATDIRKEWDKPDINFGKMYEEAQKNK